jgi:hypothetical protein
LFFKRGNFRDEQWERGGALDTAAPGDYKNLAMKRWAACCCPCETYPGPAGPGATPLP